MSDIFLKPSVSRYKLSTNYEFFAVNQEGKRIKIGGCQSLNDSQTKNVTRTHELNMEEPICVELSQGLIPGFPGRRTSDHEKKQSNIHYRNHACGADAALPVYQRHPGSRPCGRAG